MMNHHKTFYILWGGCGLFIFLLGWEYYSLRVHVSKLSALQDQYYGYIHSVKRMLRKQQIQKSNMGTKLVQGDDDEYDADAFVRINRSPFHLKESSISYVKDQNLDPLLKRINVHEWDEYTEYALKDTKFGNGKQFLQKKTTSVTPAWYSKNNKRTSLTGITFCSPVERSRYWLSSFFGSRKKPNGQIGFHHGIDMAAQRGTGVRAVASGTVEYAGYAPGYGNTIVIVHDAMYKTRYAHLDMIYVRSNQKVEQGKKIGAVGDTGYTIKKGKDASHLHFELYEQGKQVNPLALLSL